jgi:hypothetical protein
MKQGCMTVLWVIFAAGGVWVTIEVGSGITYTWLDIWTILATMALLPLYIVALVIGARQLPDTVPDPNPENPFTDIDMASVLRDAPPIQSALLLITLSAAVVMILSAIIDSVNTTIGTIWAVVVTVGLPLSGLTGYVLGRTPMENRRKFGIAAGSWVLLLFGIIFLYTAWDLHSSIRFWIGTACGLLGAFLIYHSYGKRWNPNTLDTEPTALEHWFESQWVRILLTLLIVAGFITAELLAGEEWIMGCLFTALLCVFGFLIVQTWRYRPRQEG